MTLVPLADTFVRKASVVRVIDGDTYEMRIDLGYRVEGRFLIRVRNLNTPEMNTPEGREARLKAQGILEAATDILVVSYKDAQSFARWIADVYVNGRSMVEWMT